MAATDVSDTLQAALRASGLDRVKVLHRLRLLSDNGPSYVSSELGDWLEDNGISHIRSRPYHPMTQGKIERYHRSMKNRILLENYYRPGQLEHSIAEFVEYYNNRRYTRAWTTSHRPMSTSAEHRPFSNNGRASNAKPSNNDVACISRQSQPEPSSQMSQTLS
jgi:transposase InsO family protein